MDPLHNKPPQDVAFKSGEVIAGRYRVISLLGQGGMGVVYKVEQVQLRKEFALKTILNSAISDANIRRFQSEAKAYFAVNHANIISIHDFGLLDDQTPFLVMELLSGETLAEKIKLRPLPVKTALQIFSQVCEGLAHAHEHGVIHRDIKPSNIMLLTGNLADTEYSVKILDFGIAKLAQSEIGEIQALTRTGEIFGSPLYMSPEQCSGEKIDARSDIYSLGCVLFETLTGTPPFVGENALSTMIMHQNTPAPTLKEASLGAEYPQELEAILGRMLEKDPSRRYQTLQDVSRHLAILLSENKSSKEQLAVELNATSHHTLEKISTVTMRKTSFLSLLVAVVALSGLTGYATASIPRTTTAPSVDVAVLGETRGHSSEDRADLERARQEHVSKIDVVGDPHDNDLQVFRDYKNAQSVTLVNTPVTDAGLAAFRNSNVIEFNVNHTDVRSVENIAKQPFLQRLNLGNNTFISDAALAKLVKLKMLFELDISNCAVSEDGIRKLLASRSLRIVTLSSKKFSSSFLDEMRNRMPQCAFGDDHVKSKLELLRKKLGTMPADQQYPILLELARTGMPGDSSVGYVHLDYGRIKLGEQKAGQAKQHLAAAEKIFSQNGNQVGLCETLCLQANLAANEKRFKDYDDLVGRCAKSLFQCYRHDKPATWILFQSLVNAPVGIKQMENTIAAEEKAVQILKEEPESRDFLPQICEQTARHCSETGQSARGLPYATGRLK